MEKSPLLETFRDQTMNPRLKWHSEPNTWMLQDNQLIIVSDGETDFWQRTHYGFQADNGHFLFAEIHGDFVLEAHVSCQYKHQYDQAGLMVRISDQCWVKASIEYELHESNKLGSVVTNHGYSDWATQDVSDDFTEVKLRIARVKSDYQLSFFDESDQDWKQMRIFHLFDTPVVQVGIYACSPKKGGFSAYFNYLKID